MPLGELVRKVKSDDRFAVRAVVEAAFGRPDEAALLDELWSQHAIRLERVAEIGGQVVGYVCYTTVKTKPDLDGILLGLGPLAVAPSHQRQGVGAQLVETSLAECRRNGARLIAVLGDPQYYARFGFEPAASRKMSWAGFDAGDAFRVIARKDIYASELRTIHYHPAFDLAAKDKGDP